MTAATALIADDEPLLRERLRAHLARLWPELEIVAEARNGREAIELFETHLPRIAFLDVHMPGLNGIDAARAIARREADGSIRVVVADSGAGMSRSAVPGTGLSNLESRLRGFFGAAGRLELHEARPHGLSAEIVFPARLPGTGGTTAEPAPPR